MAGCTQTWQTDNAPPTGNGTLQASRPNVTLILVPLPNCSSANSGTISPATQTSCVGSTTVMTSTGAGSTTITYSYTDANGCSATSNESVFIDDCSGINEQANNGSISVYQIRTMATSQSSSTR